MGDWADYISEQYEDYMAQNCTCHRSDEECTCLSFEAFEEEYLQNLRDAWEKDVVCAFEEQLSCQI